jgi:hypothetical protein
MPDIKSHIPQPTRLADIETHRMRKIKKDERRALKQTAIING